MSECMYLTLYRCRTTTCKRVRAYTLRLCSNVLYTHVNFLYRSHLACTSLPICLLNLSACMSINCLLLIKARLSVRSLYLNPEEFKSMNATLLFVDKFKKKILFNSLTGGCKILRCLSVCLSDCSHNSKTIGQISPILCTLRTALVQFSCGDVEISSFFSHNGPTARHVHVLSLWRHTWISNEEFVRMISPWSRWTTDNILTLLDRERFLVVYPCSTFFVCRQLATPQSTNAKIRKRQNKLIKTKFGSYA